MLLLGFAALLQSIFIPGYFGMKIFKIKTDSFFNNVILTFSISLFINYLLVTTLLFLSIYTRPVLFTIYAFELIGLLIIQFALKSRYNFNGSVKDIYTNINNYLQKISDYCKIHRIFIDVYFTLIITVIVFSLGNVFYFIDTVNNIHWNTWAMDIANNIMPQKKSHFPQLIPTNWSVFYLMIGKLNVHFFPKLIAPLFLGGILIIFLDLAAKFRDFRYLVSGMLTFILYILMNSLVFIVDGHADIPVAFFSLFTYYVFKNYKIAEYSYIKYLLFGVAAIATSATKLAGMYIFTVAYLYMFYLVIINRKEISIKSLLTLCCTVLVLGSANIFWYFSDPVTMARGFHQPEYTSPDYFIALSKSSSMIMHHLGIPVVLFVFGGLLLSFREKKNLLFNIVLVVVPLSLWALKFSPDFRNLSFVVPFLSLSAIWGWLNRTEKNINSFKGILNNKTTAIMMVPVIVFSLTPMFYELLYNIYMLIYRYYFSYAKINLTIEYGHFIHIDYIRRFIFAFAAVIIIVNSIRYIRLSYKVIVAGSLVMLITLSIFISDNQVLELQESQFKKVEYRNYYSFLYSFYKNSKNKERILTNDNYLAEMNLPQKIEFDYFNYPENPRIIIKNELLSINQSLLSKNDLNNLRTSFVASYDTLFQFENHLLLKKKK